MRKAHKTTKKAHMKAQKAHKAHMKHKLEGLEVEEGVEPGFMIPKAHKVTPPKKKAHKASKKKAHKASKKKAHKASKKKAHMKHKLEVQAVADLQGGKVAAKNPIKYSRSLGHNVVTSLTTQTATTLTVTTTPHNAEADDFSSIVAFMAYGTPPGSVTCADSLGNTYTKVSQVIFNTSYYIALFAATGIHSVAKGTIITITHPASTRRILMADEFKNVQKTSAPDQTAAAYNSVAATFATSGMTAQTAQDKELLYGIIGVNGPSTDTFKKPVNWFLLHDRGTNASDSNDIRLITQFRTVGSQGTYETSGTLGTTRLWASITQSFRAEGGASDVSKD